jgi:predicted GIY-YIG superfamily endonuclease
MTFWAYMIQCADRHFYTGHTDDLERRFGEHQMGSVPGYSSTRRPVYLVWSYEFATREEARAAELQIKSWSRAKKLALIRGDWSLISVLARSHQEQGRASTSSAKPVWRWSRDGLFLHPHLASPPSEPLSLEVGARLSQTHLHLRFRLTGDVSSILIPAPAVPARRDGLWQHACFEAFLRTSSDYLEFNLSPSGEWAAYSFTGYREGMACLDVPAPAIRTRSTAEALELTADLHLSPEGSPARLGLSAVIEERSGHKSYWALRHPQGDKPDFHHPDCFALELPPASEA